MNKLAQNTLSPLSKSSPLPIPHWHLPNFKGSVPAVSYYEQTCTKYTFPFKQMSPPCQFHPSIFQTSKASMSWNVAQPFNLPAMQYELTASPVMDYYNNFHFNRPLLLATLPFQFPLIPRD
jgi:hypothetical protein